MSDIGEQSITCVNHICRVSSEPSFLDLLNDVGCQVSTTVTVLHLVNGRNFRIHDSMEYAHKAFPYLGKHKF